MRMAIKKIIYILSVFIACLLFNTQISFPQTYTYIASSSGDYPSIIWTNNINLIFNSTPSFVKIRSSSGRFDAFLGDWNGKIYYLQNSGSPTIPGFVEITGSSNPFNSLNFKSYSAPSFVDINGDNKIDAFVGSEEGVIHYFENTGTIDVPILIERTGASDPFNGLNSGKYNSIIAFVDIDGDGDFDAFVGEDYGTITYYQNTGTSSTPIFTLQTGGSNPLSAIDVGYASAPAFVDLDADLDKDLFVGAEDGLIYYFENTGTTITPAFTPRTGSANPFNGFDVGYNSKVSFVDINGDGYFDAFIGNDLGELQYFRNDFGVLPVELISFTAKRKDNSVVLNWQTATEVSNYGFDVERKTSEQNWAQIGFIKGHGNSNSPKHYSFEDNSSVAGSKVYYRLKQIDTDGKYSYSSIIFLDILPTSFELFQNYPNPFNPVTKIKYQIPVESLVNIEVFDILGSRVINLVDEQMQPGIYEVDFNATNFPSGVYYYKIQAGSYIKTKKLILLK